MLCFTKLINCRSINTFAFLLLVQTSISVAQELTVAVDHYPPWIFTDKKPYRGIDIAIINHIAQELSLTIKFVVCPLRRCLEMAKNGQLDLIPGLFKMHDREDYLVFLEPAYTRESPKAFYVNSLNHIKIEAYADLAALTIGIKRGTKYFEQFDKDTSLKKFIVSSDIQLFNLLKVGRIDTFICHPLLAQYYIGQESLEGIIEKAKLMIGQSRPSYFALSKKSLFMEHVDVIEASIQRGVVSGHFESIAEDFLQQSKQTVINTK